MVIASTVEEFTHAILDLLNDTEEQHRLAREGRAFVEENFNWSRSAQKLEQLCQEALLAQSVIDIVAA
jgi:glycosyltransferase involved in cell wall biosynthesis